MPVYEYECKACGHAFEEWQKMSDEPVKTCPKCKKKKVERLISQTSFQLKGGGWYKDLYSSAKSDAKSGSSDSGSESKSESKAESKSDGKAAKAESKSESKAEKPASKSSDGGGKKPAGKASAK
jgi:putative FmdB family regulatory protein